MANWKLDNSHSEIEFKVKHMMISTVKGQFENFDITVESQSEDLENAKVEATIQSDSITTKNEQRDQHLKSEEFFDTVNFPEIKFVSSTVQRLEDGYAIKGELTIRDVTKEVTFQADFGGVAKDPWGNKKAGFTVTGKINRTDFGLTWNAALETGGVMVSDEVKFQADVQFVLA